jgi:hypothetical protein
VINLLIAILTLVVSGILCIWGVGHRNVHVRLSIGLPMGLIWAVAASYILVVLTS